MDSLKTAKSMLARYTTALFALAAPLAALPLAIYPNGAQAVAPGQNGRIAFEANVDGNVDIYAAFPDGSGREILTGGVAEIDSDPSFSPNGDRIAFESDRDGRGSSEIYAMSADGSGAIRLTNNPASDQAPSYSPDGQTLAFYRFDSDAPHVYTMNTNGSNQRKLAEIGGRNPTWIPDGTAIVFEGWPDVRGGGDPDLYAMNSDGSNVRRLTTNALSAGVHGDPSVSPDGEHIVFASDKMPGASPGGDIFVINRDGTGLVRLTLSGGYAPAYSPDGTKISYVRSGQIFTMNADRTAQQAFPGSFGRATQPNWGARVGSGPPPPPGITYVALGDSFSSGEGNPSFDVGTDSPDNGCHRSTQAWPRIAGAPIDLHYACSGAKIRDLYSGRTKASPDNVGQLVRLRRLEHELSRHGDHVDVVTVTIGGNDPELNFKPELLACFAPTIGCLQKFQGQRGNLHLTRLTLKLRVALRLIRSAAPQAEVILVGYPRLFPSTQEANVSCSGISSEDRIRANTLAVNLDQAYRQVARTAGVTYVSTLDTLDGHELCTKDSWMFPLDIPTFITDARQGHPLVQWQRTVADLVKPTE